VVRCSRAAPKSSRSLKQIILEAVVEETALWAGASRSARVLQLEGDQIKEHFEQKARAIDGVALQKMLGRQVFAPNLKSSETLSGREKERRFG
jgi:pantoate kinase